MYLTDMDSLPGCVLGVVCHMIEAVSTALYNQQNAYQTPHGREVMAHDLHICSKKMFLKHIL